MRVIHIRIKLIRSHYLLPTFRNFLTAVVRSLFENTFSFRHNIYSCDCNIKYEKKNKSAKSPADIIYKRKNIKIHDLSNNDRSKNQI